MEQKPKDLLTIAEFADALSLKESTIRQWIWRSEIKFFKIRNKSIRIPRSEVERILAEGERPARRK